MANDYFQRKEDAGDGGVEGGSDRSGNAATQQSTGQMRRQAQAPGYAAGDGSAQMHYGAFASG